MVLSSNTIKFLDKVRREGERIARYDKETIIDNTTIYDDTETVFVYAYQDEKGKLQKVIIFMERGEYKDYYLGGI